ncbi:hypothetical protein HWI79_2823 [Cryptosporidium felis]|nr:hypothetical protein HWI79_2823 [Cryptosporidium felis]
MKGSAKRHQSTKSINCNSGRDGSVLKKKKTKAYESNSDHDDSDSTIDSGHLVVGTMDLYSKWMNFLREDLGTSENAFEATDLPTSDLKRIEKPIGETESIASCIEEEEVVDTGPEASITERRDYFLDFTDQGMQKIPELMAENGLESGRRDSGRTITVPGFSPYKLERCHKSERIKEVEIYVTEPQCQNGGKLHLENFQMDSKLRQNWSKRLESLKILDSYEFRELSTFYEYLNGYVDIDFPQLKAITSPWTMSLCVLHLSKHIYLSRQQVTKNNSSLQGALNDKQNSKIDFFGEDKFRDQGFNRCRALILCPFKGIAKEFVDTLVNILPHGKVLRGFERFEEEFGFFEDQNELGGRTGKKTEVEINEPLTANNESDVMTAEEIGKYDELYKYLFEGKNRDDEFKFGIQLSKSGINLFSPFEKSDIIVASPLGIRRTLRTTEGRNPESSFLSSIELCFVFGADIINMQNWEHLLDVFKLINKLPRKSLGNCDIRRVYQAFIDGRAREFRQTIVISANRLEDINSLFRSHTCNRRGFVRLWNPTEKMPGFSEKKLAIYKAPRLVCGIQQMFIKTGESGSPEDSFLSYLSSRLYPDILAAVDGHTQKVLIILPNYVSYLRVRKYLLQQNAVFASCNESSSKASLSRNRLAFYKGELPILITTERFLFFRRYLLKGATKVIFCSPPIYPNIYLDCIQSINFSQGPNKSNSKESAPLVITLFHWQNSLALERIVGTSKCSSLVQNSKVGKPMIFKIP